MNFKYVFFNIIIVLIFSFSTAAAFSNSGDGEWEYQKNIIIKENSGEILTDYQIVVELNTLNFPIEAKTDGSDIRFSDENGIELNYWIEEWNYPSTAKIWVNIQNIPANGEIKLLMYYGNPSAVSASNGEATFVFFDHFEGTNLDLVKWHQGAFGNDGIDILSYSDSVLKFRGSGCGGHSSDWRFAKSNEKWNGDEIALRAKTKRYNGISHVGFGYDSSISDLIYFNIGFDPVYGENRLDTILAASNVGSNQPYQHFYNMASETWYIVDLMRNENILRGRISDSTGSELKLVETDIDRNGDVFLCLCGVYNCITVYYYYDWILVRKYALDEPTIIDIYIPSIPSTINIDPDTLNLKSKGIGITSYIELPEDYDLADIDISTILLEDTISAEANPTEIGDYDNDGIADLMVKFDMSAVQGILEVGDEIVITVMGELTDGTPFEGSDTIRVIDS